MRGSRGFWTTTDEERPHRSAQCLAGIPLLEVTDDDEREELTGINAEVSKWPALQHGDGPDASSPPRPCNRRSIQVRSIRLGKAPLGNIGRSGTRKALPTRLLPP